MGSIPNEKVVCYMLAVAYATKTGLFHIVEGKYILDGSSSEYNKAVLDQTLLFLNESQSNRESALIVNKYWDELHSIDHNNFLDNYYSEHVDRLVDQYKKTDKGCLCQPKELTELICGIIRKENCASVFNPFSGFADYALELSPDTIFIGQEPNILVWYISNIITDAHDLSDLSECTITTDSPLKLWPQMDVDCVISTPPFSQKILQGYFESYNEYSERYMFDSYELGGPSLFITLVPEAFLYSDAYRASRRNLLQGVCYTEITKLPVGLFPNTSISMSLIVVYTKRDEGANPLIRFIDASKCIKYSISGSINRTPILDIEKYQEILKSPNTSTNFTIDAIDDLVCDDADKDILLSDYYISRDITVPENQVAMTFDSLVEIDRGTSLPYLLHDVLSNDDFSDDLYDIELHCKDFSYKKQGRSVAVVSGPHLILNWSHGQLGIYKHDSDTDLFISKLNHIAVKPIHNINLDYLCYVLLSNPSFSSYRAFSVSGQITKTDLQVLARYQFAVTNDAVQQREIVGSEIQKGLTSKEQELSAEKGRLGIKEVSSDIAHMLGTVFHMQNTIIDTLALQDDAPAELYHKTTSKLVDTVKFVQRFISNFGKDIDPTTFKIREVSICSFISSYIQAWKNFGHKGFTVKFDTPEEGLGELLINADSDTLLCMFDTIFDNAYRHGFLKKASKNNLLSLSIHTMLIEDKPYCMISFANNGQPMPKGFTAQDYITKGRFSATSGRTGLGGYHIHAIAKGNYGYLNIDTTEDYPVIINVFLPMDKKALSNPDYTFYSYDGELL